jgi:hypothetical protein
MTGRVATSIRLQSLLRPSRAAVGPGHGASLGKQSPADSAAAALHGQLAFEDTAQDRDREEEGQKLVVLSPEGMAALERYGRDAADRAAAAPKVKKRKGRPGSGAQQPRRVYRPRRR